MHKFSQFSLALGVLALSGNSMASVLAIGPGAFPGGSTILSLTGLADNTEVNGLIVDGVMFNYSLGNGQLLIDGGPGITNNITPPNIVSAGDNSGVLTVTLPSLAMAFGYGYAVLDTVAVPNATTINLFNGATPVGSLSFNGTPDPTFAGGFAGVSSTLAFNRVELTFSSATPAFALDNLTFDATGGPSGGGSTVPEPSTVILMAMGMGLLFWRRSGGASRND